MPCVTSTNVDKAVGLMNSSYVPHHSNWNIPADSNLITLYGLTISVRCDMKSDPKKPKRIVIIDCEKSVVPKGYPFSMDEVVEKVKACVKLNFGTEEIKVLSKKG